VFLLTTSSWAGTFRDDFSDGDLKGWTKIGNVVVIDGRCKISSFGGCALIMLGELEWRDYSVEFEVQSNHASGYIGVRVRVQDFQNGYPWIINCADNTALWYTQINDQFSRITSDKIVGDLVDKSHVMKAVVKGNELRGYYDGKHVRTVHLDIFDTGRILIGVCSSGSAFYDNVVITGAGIPNVGPSGYYGVQPKSKLATKWGRLKQ